MTIIPSTVFISHASEDKLLALLLKKLIESLSTNNIKIKVFCSSDIGDIQGGKKWFDEIMNALRASKICVSLMTPNSIYKPWVLYESGGAYTLFGADTETSRLFPVCAYGMSGSILPGPFKEIQARQIDQKTELMQLCREIGAVLGNANLKPLSSIVNKVCDEAAKGVSHWSNVRQTLVGERMDSSPFSIENTILEAKHHLFIAGQNLYHLATNRDCKNQIFNFLKGGTNRKVSLLICDPEATHAVEAWKVVGDKYPDDLAYAVSTYKKWLGEAKKKNLKSTLDVRVTSLVTTSIVCIDPEMGNGKMILVPVVFGKPLSGERPHFVATKKDHARIFDHYWETYRNVFHRSKSVIRVK